MKIGILGGGQLAQMLMLSSYPLGIETEAYEEHENSPSALVGKTTLGKIDETENLHEWASRCDAVTYEFENFPAPLVGDLAEVCPVLPGPIALATAQDRWFEKRLLAELKIPLAPFRLIENEADIFNALSELGSPVIFKTRTGGYDGKGQIVYDSGDPVEPVLELLASGHLVVEEKLKLDKEVSIIGVRGRDGTSATYPLVENEHRNGILHKSVAPSGINPRLAAEAREFMDLLLKELEYVGVLALELFIVGDRLLANEMAPRVHNSGHWTIEGAETSQFENHIRAVAGLPIGNTELITPTAMVNLVGAIPDATNVLRIGGTHLHLYGKEPRPGRKVGHITVTAGDSVRLAQRVTAVEAVVHNVLS